MVEKDEEVMSKPSRDQLETRIGQTRAGYEWLLRIKQIGKGGLILSDAEEPERESEAKT